MKSLINFKNYYLPTPKKWRKIGDAFLAVGVFVTAGGLIEFDKLSQIFNAKELKVIIGIAFALGVLGKFLTNLFKEDGNGSDKPTV
jgi:flagellar motor component MotA